jgi:formylmethanofuran dehydrogenase subunit E
MRFSTVKEDDGSALWAQCSLCDREIYRGEEHYQVNGQVFCTGCLEEFAEGWFAPFLCKGGEDTWR